MAATGAAAERREARVWVFGLVPLALVALAAGLFVAFGAPGLGERVGPPAEELVVERTVLRPGEIELTVRNDGPDAVSVEQVAVNDAYVQFSPPSPEIPRLGSERLRVLYPWIEGEAYELFLLTSTGGTVEHSIEIAVATPVADTGFYGLMALLGIYVGVIPVALGMLWLPFVRRVGERWVRVLMALTVGLLAFLGLDAALEGIEIAEAGPQAFGGAALVFLGAAVAYLVLAAVEAHVHRRVEARRAEGASGMHLALLVAIGIGLHNLGEGLAIGAAYSVGALALGTLLVVGFALHNTTEGLAIVAPVADSRPSLLRLVGLGLVAGAPAILGAAIGAAAFNSSLSAFLLGAAAGAIVRVVQQLAPQLRDGAGRALQPATVAGIVAGFAVMYATGLLVSA